MNEVISGDPSHPRPANDDLIKGWKWVCTMDTSTCLTCLENDGKPAAEAAKPHHEGCRCALTPILRSLKEIGIEGDEIPPSTRASSLGQIRQDGGLYKEYLIQRAKAFAVAQRTLEKWLHSRTDTTAEKSVASAILADLVAAGLEPDPQSVAWALDNWQGVSLMPSGDALVQMAARHGLGGHLVANLQRLSQSIEEGPYANRHRRDLWLTSVDAIMDMGSMDSNLRQLALTMLHTCMQNRVDSDAATLVKLAQRFKKLGEVAQAIELTEEAVAADPTSKSAAKELDKLKRI